MFDEPNYERDLEFRKLVGQEDVVDLTRVSLELARDAYPELDMSTTLNWIDQRADELRARMAVREDLESLLTLSACLADQYGLCGSKAAFDDPDSSYLQRVVETGRGIPISLSLIYMAVAERLELPLRGVSAPLHFLTRMETGDEPIFLDAFSRGRALTLSECLEWLSEAAELPESQLVHALEPVGPQTIVVRMLNNLKVLHAKREDWAAAWKVQHRLTALEPASYNERRDLGIISLHAGRFDKAVDVLKQCLKICPPPEEAILEGHLKEAHQKLSEWN